jgi:8-oxo-dGTP pyrophosphatase MutT (NUDIX family)
MSFTGLNNRMTETLSITGDLPVQIAQALSAGRRGAGAKAWMAPEMSYGRHAGPAPATARQAAVILLLFRREGRWLLPLTERPAALLRHGGQISLPGGVVEPNESSSDAALRELEEELGIDAPVGMLGRLADCYVFASDFIVTPWIAAARFEPQWRPHDREVQAVVELPLEALLDERSVGRTTIERGSLVFHAPCLRVGTTCIWGATSVILGELAEVLQQSLSSLRTK